MIRLLAALDSPPVAEVVNAVTYCVVADAAGLATRRSTADSELPATTAGPELTLWGSEVVATETRASPTRVVLVTPPMVMVTRSPAATVRRG